MKKGQISIDLLLTLVIVLLAVISMGAIALTYSEANEISTIQQELQYTANKTAALITSTQAISDSNFSIEAKIGKVFFTDENKNYKSTYPNMDIIDGNKIILSITINGLRQDANAFFYKDINTIIDTTNFSSNGKVVIRRAK
ncbi:MAG: hypothetical protein WCI04_05035 [archaeon]